VSYKLRNLVLLATALTFLFVCRLPHSFGINYYALGIYSNTLIQSPTVILVDGSDDVSYVYTNNTSAKISINATLTELTYNYSLNIVNNDSSLWQVKLEYFEFVNISRVNATIILHNNSTTSDQITINSQGINQTNEYYNLTGNAVIHIGVKDLIENSSSGKTILDVYLRMKTPNTTTYTLYIITFEFT